MPPAPPVLPHRAGAAPLLQAGPDPSVPAPGEKSPDPRHLAFTAPAERKGESFCSFPAFDLHELQLEPKLEISRVQKDGGGRLAPPLPLSFEPRAWLWSIILGGSSSILGLSVLVESVRFSSFASPSRVCFFFFL